jgi:ppGpp synthetase/RelA/SpoT-type nucleotidyltranferase
MDINFIDKVWEDSPLLIRSFYEKQFLYNSLKEEVLYILNKEIEEAAIEVASISARTKSIESFCEKIFRKTYEDPINDITDLCGARVVYLYQNDREKIESIIENNFAIIEKVDKQYIDIDRFGYGALHYIVTLKENLAGARYDGIRNTKCEIQVRTILQDAWAIVAHHLSYKKESDIPPKLHRKLNALAGLFDTADDQFQSIRDARIKYSKHISKSIINKDANFMSSEIKPDSLIAFLEHRLPDRKTSSPSEMPSIINQLNKDNIFTFQQLENLLSEMEPSILASENKRPPVNTSTGEKSKFTQAGFIRMAINLND